MKEWEGTFAIDDGRTKAIFLARDEMADLRFQGLLGSDGQFAFSLAQAFTPGKEGHYYRSHFC